jgi:hypothetical protein
MTTRHAAVWTLAHWHLAGKALVEFVLRHWLGLRFVLAHVGVLPLPERGRTGFHQTWRRGRFAQVAQDLADGTGVGDDGDDSHLAAAACTDERKDLMAAMPEDSSRQTRLGKRFVVTDGFRHRNSALTLTQVLAAPCSRKYHYC